MFMACWGGKCFTARLGALCWGVVSFNPVLVLGFVREKIRPARLVGDKNGTKSPSKSNRRQKANAGCAGRVLYRKWRCVARAGRVLYRDWWRTGLVVGGSGTKFALLGLLATKTGQNSPSKSNRRQKKPMRGVRGEFCTASAGVWCVRGEFCTGSGAARLAQGELYTGAGGVWGLLLAVAG